MDLALTSEEVKFRSDLRSWLSEVLPEGSPRQGKNLFTRKRETYKRADEILFQIGYIFIKKIFT